MFLLTPASWPMGMSYWEQLVERGGQPFFRRGPWTAPDDVVAGALVAELGDARATEVVAKVTKASPGLKSVDAAATVGLVAEAHSLRKK